MSPTMPAASGISARNYGGHAFLLGLAAAAYARATGRRAHLAAGGVGGWLTAVDWHGYNGLRTSSPGWTGSRGPGVPRACGRHQHGQGGRLLARWGERRRAKRPNAPLTGPE